MTAATVDSVYASMLLGRDPLDRETLWIEMYNRLRDHGQKGAVIEALSAVDIALWDIAGKRFGVPAHRLAGRAFRTRVPAYATGLYRRRSPENLRLLAREAEARLQEGFRALKVKIGFGLAYDAEVVAAIRAAVGPGIGLAVDANHAYDASTALRVCERLAPLGLLWFEEPVLPEDLAGYLELRRHTSVPLAGGEAEFTRYGFRELISRRALDIVQPDCCAVGGLSEALKVADMADAWQVRCMPHVWGTGVAIAAALQMLAMIAPCPPSLEPQEPMLEYDRSPNPLRDAICGEGFGLRDGMVDVPQGPGIGVAPDRRVLERFLLR